MYHRLSEIFAVVGPIHLVGPRLVEVAVVVWGHDAQALFLLIVGALYHLVDNSAEDQFNMYANGHQKYLSVHASLQPLT